MVSEKSEPLFALDIGTRTVVGLTAIPGTKGLTIKAVEILEHETRSMLDGQIHDIPRVAELIRRLKGRLEKKVGPLRDVAVAAAGRALKTCRGKAVRAVNGSRLEADAVRGLELEALEQARRELAGDEESAGRYHCVGYSVVEYELDGTAIGNLLGQRGQEAGAEVIGTFLPKVVVESLAAALEAADLRMRALTLEPIAAIHALIPASMRKLNLALVDVGAGTSDIAVTAEGTVVAYGMVPSAGDEITEALAETWLLDFDTAETAKRSWRDPEIRFTDVLGHSRKVPGPEFIQSMASAVDGLSELIAREILSLNGRPPAAVLLIGGGSLTPGLPESLARKLGLPQDRVAVRSVEHVAGFARIPARLRGPDGVTPLGIALAALEHPVQTAAVRVGDAEVHLFDFRDLTVGDALIQAGIHIRSLFGRPGAALTVTIGGERRVLPGSPGSGPEIRLNGSPATLGSPVTSGDHIEVRPGQNGKDAWCRIEDLIPPLQSLSVYVNGESQPVPPRIFMNGDRVKPDTPVIDRATIEAYIPERLQDVLEDVGRPEAFSQREIHFTWNGRSVQHVHPNWIVTLNGEAAEPGTVVAAGDRIEIVEAPPPVLADWLVTNPERTPGRPALTVTVNGRLVRLDGEDYRAFRCNGRPADPGSPLQDGDDWVEVWDGQVGEWIISDLFRVIDPEELRPADARSFHVEVNGAEATFTTPLHTGDNVRLYWR
ncbi:MAG: rod shape-determining protein [Kyrpidia tusciae]|nr:cell division FtsA domain-containing protein [Kyrpidia tusciae]MBE3552353.1 rod shape-determining protein [Kyrpidia tusciae]